MRESNVLERIQEFATEAHGEQRRKYTPEPYIVHPVRVMQICSMHTKDVRILGAALLHDVLEDTPVDKDQMLRFLRSLMNEEDAATTLRLVVELTDVYTKEAYPQYNRRQRKDLERQRIILTSPDSQTVKYADIIDNCREIVKHDRHFANVFLKECKTTLKVMRSGNQRLFEEATRVVDDAIASLRNSA